MADTETTMPPGPNFDTDPMQKRKDRWWEIRNRISASGEVTDPEEADQLADDIEEWENADGDVNEAGQRRAILGPMMSGGYVKMKNLLPEAKRSIARAFTFEKKEE